ncbi:sigma factor-like helix-turn-helix DNA-binding protein [Sandaracinus amylolyticus]|uniref:DNA-binding protein AsgB n=1 Tax=Sandaracinus amylolyticus TaxID=927083 RepID=A0A0F6SF80_9BACT|nr:sigma factor-like helix-turn-helix DNA-binding protein [Sandaracinus amylolyticus]AKF06479.1 DNA-binding protein AsgB [Sandaracinus amylolyticus]UJR80905.1 RNA polymerase sigma factor RpoD [Sandaracinus amylolyticus]
MSEQQELDYELEQGDFGGEGDEDGAGEMPPALDGSLALALAAETDEDAEDGDEKGRRKRRNRARARTISIRRLSKAELNRGKMLYPETDYWKPTTRAECIDMERPCPFVSCKYHLYLDVHPVRGSIKVNFTDIEVWEMTETCALDIADRGGITLEEVGEIMNLTRERVRQVETAGLAKLAALQDVARLKDYCL